MSAGRLNALVMAANRRGAEDSVAKMAGVSHKCIAKIDGVPMIERVVGALIEAGCFETIYISIEDEDVLRALPQMVAWMDSGRAKVVKSGETLADSIISASRDVPDLLPFIITTGDNVLHTPQIIRDFAEAFLASEKELSLGFAREADVAVDFPDSGLAYHRLRDGGFSSCNLFGLKTGNALQAVEVFRSGGQFGKRHWRILKSFGLMPFLLYKTKAVTAQQLIGRIGRNLGVSLEVVFLPHSWGPIDVDNPDSFRLSEEVLRKRRKGA